MNKPQTPTRQYSKSSLFYGAAKRDFFEQNGTFLQRAQTLNKMYIAQPKRTNCKLCDAPLGQDIDFTSHNVGYVFCSECGHLNGTHEETEAFVSSLYIDGEGVDYAKNYIDNNFEQRIETVYSPKAEFLAQNMPQDSFSVFDVGCGAGYFVAACRKQGIAATGIDVSDTMIDFGNEKIAQIDGDSNALKRVEERDFLDLISTCDAQVVSAIGVIEHVRDPRGLLHSFQQSKAQYLYFSVPMFSFSALLENVSQSVFPRQLSGAHTHLFTESSIKKMYDMISVSAVAEWRFGTDVQDLFRTMQIKLQEGGASGRILELFADQFGGLADKWQRQLDESHFCSEIHVLVSK